jgi:hypothetical protein
MTYQHKFVMKLNLEYEKHLEFMVYAVMQPSQWVSEHMRLKKPHMQTMQLTPCVGVMTMTVTSNTALPALDL